MSLAGGVDGLIISGLSAFLPKFIEQQYQISNGVAAQLVGLIVVPAGGGGTFFGGCSRGSIFPATASFSCASSLR